MKALGKTESNVGRLCEGMIWGLFWVLGVMSLVFSSSAFATAFFSTSNGFEYGRDSCMVVHSLACTVRILCTLDPSCNSSAYDRFFHDVLVLSAFI